MAAGVEVSPRTRPDAVMAPARARLTSLWVLPLFVLLSLAFYHDYLSGGFVLDDLVIAGSLRQHPAPALSWLRLWAFGAADNPCAHDFWWADPTATLSFFRPLPSLLVAVFYHAFGGSAVPLHLLSILLHALVAFTTFRLFAALTGKITTSFAAGLILLASGRLLTVGWIAALPDLPCAIFINLALLAHLRWRATRRPVLLAWSLLSLVLALACKESAVVAPAGIVLLEWILGRSEGRPLAAMARRCGPSLMVLFVFVASYRLFHLGDVNNLLYLSPVSQPALYLRNAVVAVPVLLATALTIKRTPPLGWPPHLPIKTVLLGGAAWLFLLWALKPLWRHPAVRWASAFFVLALLPQAATEPGQRLLYCSLVPLSFLLAMVVSATAPRLFGHEAEGPAEQEAASSPTGRRMPLVTRAWGVYAVFGLVLPGLARSYHGTQPILAAMRLPEQRIMATAGTVGAHLRRHPTATVIVLNTGGPQPTLYVGALYVYLFGPRVTTRVLASLDGPATLERTGPRSFVISTDRPGWFGGYLVRLARRDPHLAVGQTYRTPLFDAKLLQLTPDGWDVRSVAFTFHTPLDDSRLLFLAWNGKAIAPFDLAGLALHRPVSLAGAAARPPATGR